MLNPGLISALLGKDCVLYLMPYDLWSFPVWLGGRGTISSPMWAWASLWLILSGDFSPLPRLLSLHDQYSVLTSTYLSALTCWVLEGDPLQGRPRVFPLCGCLSGSLSCNPGCLCLPSSQPHLLNSESPPGSVWVPSPRAAAWKIYHGSKPGNHRAPLICVPSSGITALYCLVASVLNTIVSYILSPV